MLLRAHASRYEAGTRRRCAWSCHACYGEKGCCANRSFPLAGLALSHLGGFRLIALAAQIGLVSHIFSLLVPALGAQLASLGIGLATGCAIVGRTAVGWLLPADADRRRAAAATYVLQGLGSLAFIVAGGTDLPFLLLGIVLFGLGIGNAASLPPLIAQQDFSPADTARVVALVMACTGVANALAPAAFGVLRDLATGGRADGAATAFFLAAATAQFAAAAIACVPRFAGFQARR